MPLTVSHLGEEPEEDDSATATGPFSTRGVSQRRRQILSKKVDKEEEEKESLVLPPER